MVGSMGVPDVQQYYIRFHGGGGARRQKHTHIHTLQAAKQVVFHGNMKYVNAER